jgi:hypothetical protein
MGEHVWPGLLLDETKTFGLVELLNGSCNSDRHNNILSKTEKLAPQGHVGLENVAGI